MLEMGGNIDVIKSFMGIIGIGMAFLGVFLALSLTKYLEKRKRGIAERLRKKCVQRK